LRKRTEYTWIGTNWAVKGETRYIYDGMRVIQERNSANTPTVSYTRGSDLSGTFEGAGGIGGLLARSHAYQSGDGSWTNHNYYHADGGGNITYLVDSSQNLAASYRYDPFGNTISSSGTLASTNIYRFSSKEFHAASAMYYYGYRFYDPNLQRWPNRDPLAEQGHRVLRGACTTCYSALLKDVNSYLFCVNSPTLKYDPYGLLTQEDCDEAYQRDMKNVQQAGAKCLSSAIKWGVIGEVLLGGGGAVVGAIFGNVPGAGAGLVAGTGANLIIDACHLHHCQKKVDKMKQDADKAKEDCLKKVTQ